MRRLISYTACIIIFIALTARYTALQTINKTGVTFLLPINVNKIEQDAFSSFVRIDYHNFIPVTDLVSEKGTIVVQKQKDNSISYVSVYNGEPLRSNEFLLKYNTFLKPYSEMASVRFGSELFRFKAKRAFDETRIYYAIIKANESGIAEVTGIADNKGMPLAKRLSD